MDERLRELQELLRAQFGIDVGQVLATPPGELPPMFDGGTFAENISAPRPTPEQQRIERQQRYEEGLDRRTEMVKRLIVPEIGAFDAPEYAITEGGQLIEVRPGGLFHQDPIELAASTIPFVGGIQAGRDAIENFREGNVGRALFDIATIPLDFIPGAGAVDGVAASGRGAAGAALDANRGSSRVQGGIVRAGPERPVTVNAAPRSTEDVVQEARRRTAESFRRVEGEPEPLPIEIARNARSGLFFHPSPLAVRSGAGDDAAQNAVALARSMDEVTDRVIETALANPEGFTINPFTGALHTVEDGRYIVAPSKKTELFAPVISTGDDARPMVDRAQVRDWVERHWDALKEGKAGGWFDKETNRFVFDVSRGYDDLDQALDVAIRGKQDAVFDLGKMETIRTPSREEFARERGRRQRALRPRAPTEEVLAEGTPGGGIYPKPKDANKSTPIPPLSTVRDRLADTEAAVRRAEIEQGGRQWSPVERGVFDRTQRGLLRSGNTLPEATGTPNPLLGELLDNPRLMRLLERQVNLGLDRGGDVFYDLSPIAASYDEMGGPLTFRDFVGATSAGSVQSPLPIEVSNASILLYAMRNGIPYEEAVTELMRRYPHSKSPWFSKGHASLFDRYRETGSIDPKTLASGSRKVPSYFRQKLGETGAEAPVVGHPTATFDTHESKAVLHPIGAERWAENLTGAEYNQIEDMIYRPLARRIGVPEEAVQAGRWLGGGPLTGLKSPMGDYVQGLEDVLYWSALQTGRSTDPAALRDYWRAVAQGQDFVLPFFGKGGVPIPNSGGLFR